MIRLAREHGISVEDCVAGTGLHGDELTDPTREILGQQELTVLRNILRVLDRTVPFGLLAGLRYRATMMGAWGFAVITSPDVRTAVHVGLRYIDLSYSFNHVSFRLDGQRASFLFDSSANPDDLRATLVERDLAALIAMQRDILGKPLPMLSMQLRAARPPYASAFEPVFALVPQWGASTNSVTIDARMLDVSGPFADELGLRVSEDLCRDLLERRRARAGIAGRVRAGILRRPGKVPDMKTIATELGMTPRTLRNHLRREGTSYRGVVDETREAVAEQLLAANLLTLDEISERLGYSDTSSFIAAFKRWKGVAPGSYRSERGQ